MAKGTRFLFTAALVAAISINLFSPAVAMAEDWNVRTAPEWAAMTSAKDRGALGAAKVAALGACDHNLVRDSAKTGCRAVVAGYAGHLAKGLPAGTAPAPAPAPRKDPTPRKDPPEKNPAPTHEPTPAPESLPEPPTQTSRFAHLRCGIDAHPELDSKGQVITGKDGVVQCRCDDGFVEDSEKGSETEGECVPVLVLNSFCPSGLEEYGDAGYQCQQPALSGAVLAAHERLTVLRNWGGGLLLILLVVLGLIAREIWWGRGARIAGLEFELERMATQRLEERWEGLKPRFDAVMDQLTRLVDLLNVAENRYDVSAGDPADMLEAALAMADHTHHYSALHAEAVELRRQLVVLVGELEKDEPETVPSFTGFLSADALGALRKRAELAAQRAAVAAAAPAAALPVAVPPVATPVAAPAAPAVVVAPPAPVASAPAPRPRPRPRPPGA